MNPEPFRRFFREARQSAVDATLYAQPKMFVFGLIATLGFPSYYLVWTQLFPQPYENLGLRISLAVLASPLLIVRFWPLGLRRLLPVYWFSTLTVCLPVFFSFMLLQNQVNLAWSASFVIAVMLVLLIVDTVSAFLMVCFGTLIGVGLFLLPGGNSIPWSDVLALAPITVFALVAGAAFNLAQAREQRARDLMARALGGHIAHELGNPLQAIGYGATQTKRHLPDLIETYRAARRVGLDIPVIAESHLRFLDQVGELTEAEVEHARFVLDLMLKKAGSVAPPSDHEIRSFSIMDCVQDAVARYVFTDPEQRGWIQLDAQADFIVVANRLLVSHVVLNLLRNAIQAVKAARRHDLGSIRIWAEAGERGGALHIADNGIGIDAETRMNMFRPFFTTRSGGTGLGLHFCRNVMQRCGGRIDFHSAAGRGTEFILRFPAPRHRMPAPAAETADCAGA